MTPGIPGRAQLHRLCLIQLHKRAVYPAEADEFVDDLTIAGARLAGHTPVRDEPYSGRCEVIRSKPASQLTAVMNKGSLQGIELR